MQTIKIALLGFGTVGQGVFQILNEKKEEFRNFFGIDVEVVGVLIRDVEKLRPLPAHLFVTDRFEDIASIPDVDVVFEAIVGEEPAYSYLTYFLERGIHVITANKAMFAKHGLSLQKVAENYDATIGYEATTAGGVPIIKTLKNLLQVNEVENIAGILNGTSNFILSEMRTAKCTFEEALQNAQDFGYAEADPTDDVSGKDAFRKLMILSQLAFGRQPSWEDVEVRGIQTLTLRDIEEAEESGMRYRHVAEVNITGSGNLQAVVRPLLVGPSHPLYTVDGVDNAIVIDSEYLGKLTLIGPGAGRFPTGSAMVEDFVQVISSKPKVIIPQ
ncbi:homoserine dehydrogenase [Chungangia koreensis]|uniref:Homoserine dehydrogenase n=1 Tax=Chungangia koreensis TaxID=752657 RepID=A0ABV8X6A7_9LACT